QTRQRGAGGVGMKNLQQEHMNGCYWIENPVAERVFQVSADLENGFRRDRLRDIGLELAQAFRDSWGHPWPPGLMGLLRCPILSGSHCWSEANCRRRKSRRGQYFPLT